MSTYIPTYNRTELCTSIDTSLYRVLKKEGVKFSKLITLTEESEKYQIFIHSRITFLPSRNLSYDLSVLSEKKKRAECEIHFRKADKPFVNANAFNFSTSFPGMAKIGKRQFRNDFHSTLQRMGQSKRIQWSISILQSVGHIVETACYSCSFVGTVKATAIVGDRR